MRYLFIALFFVVLSMQPAFADEVLSGDTRLACEAVLCLSSGMRPGECSPSLSRYFGINKKKWSQTLQARRNFLNLCPSTSAPGMPSLVESIVNAAGQCSAEVLNRVLSRQIVIRVCDDARYWLPEEERCYDKTITVIDNTLPSYCRTYANHEYTWKVSARYAGEVMKGGQWVDN